MIRRQLRLGPPRPASKLDNADLGRTFVGATGKTLAVRNPSGHRQSRIGRDDNCLSPNRALTAHKSRFPPTAAPATVAWAAPDANRAQTGCKPRHGINRLCLVDACAGRAVPATN
jgi:hypothetical protein